MALADNHLNANVKYIVGGVILSCFLYLVLIQNFDMYSYVVLGAIYELSTLPVLLLSVASPFLSLYFWSREKFTVKSWFFYLFITALALAGYVVFMFINE